MSLPPRLIQPTVCEALPASEQGWLPENIDLEWSFDLGRWQAIPYRMPRAHVVPEPGSW